MTLDISAQPMGPFARRDLHESRRRRSAAFQYHAFIRYDHDA